MDIRKCMFNVVTTRNCFIFLIIYHINNHRSYRPGRSKGITNQWKLAVRSPYCRFLTTNAQLQCKYSKHSENFRNGAEQAVFATADIVTMPTDFSKLTTFSMMVSRRQRRHCTEKYVSSASDIYLIIVQVTPFHSSRSLTYKANSFTTKPFQIVHVS